MKLREIIQNTWCEGDKVEKDSDTFGTFLDRAANAISEAGYCKIEGRPPVLSDEEEEIVETLVREFWNTQGREVTREYFGVSANDRAIAQAKRDADVIFYDKQIVNKENKENL